MVALSDDQKSKVLKQVEFYFSDSNLPKDKFLKDKIAQGEDGYVDLNIIIAFARMRSVLQLDNVKDPAGVPADVITAVAETLKASTQLDVDESNTRIKRKTALPDEAQVAAAIDARSLYARPFPMDATIDTLTDFFAKSAPVNCVRMRRHLTSKSFKGSLFVEFASVEDKDKVLGMSLEFEGAPLTLIDKVKYMNDKREQRKQRGGRAKCSQNLELDDEASNDGLPDGADGTVDGKGDSAISPMFSHHAGGDHGGRGGHHGGRGGRGDRGGFQQGGGRGQKRGRHDDDNEDEEECDEGDFADKDSGRGRQQGHKRQQQQEEEEKDPQYIKGVLLSFNLNEALPDVMGPRSLTDVFGGRDKARFVELSEDKKGGVVRFASPEVAAGVLSEFNGRPEGERTIATITATMRTVEGDEELQYYKRMVQAHKNKEARNGGHGGRGGGGGRGGRGGRGGGGGGRGGGGGFRGGRGKRGRY